MNQVRRVQELRRSNAAAPVRNKKKYRRNGMDAKYVILDELDDYVPLDVDDDISDYIEK